MAVAAPGGGPRRLDPLTNVKWDEDIVDRSFWRLWWACRISFVRGSIDGIREAGRANWMKRTGEFVNFGRVWCVVELIYDRVWTEPQWILMRPWWKAMTLESLLGEYWHSFTDWPYVILSIDNVELLADPSGGGWRDGWCQLRTCFINETGWSIGGAGEAWYGNWQIMRHFSWWKSGLRILSGVYWSIGDSRWRGS